MSVSNQNTLYFYNVFKPYDDLKGGGMERKKMLYGVRYM